MIPKIYDEKQKPIISNVVGNKAFNLFKIMDCANVPKFIAIDSSEMLKILHLKENSKYNERIRTLWLNKLSLSHYFEEIQEIIVNLYIPKTWINKIREKLLEYGIIENLAVRSSSVYEDIDCQSAPGVFLSLLDVKYDELENAIKKCWSSHFTMKCVEYFGNSLDNFDNIKMGIIIQQMILCEESGILFTRNPINNKKEIVIERVIGECDKLTDGSVAVKTDYLDVGYDKLTNELIGISNMLKARYEKELDIEWAYKLNKIFILQVRAISNLNRKVVDEHKVVSISDIDTINYIGSGLEKKICRWSGKKMHFNRACDIEEIKHIGWYFVQNYNEEMFSECEKIVKEFSGEYVTIAINNTLSDIVIKKEEIISFLQNYCRNRAGNNIVSIKEIPINQISLISTITEDGEVYIEAIDGIMKGLKTGELKPSKYVVNNGNIIVKNEVHNSKCYQIHFPDGMIDLVDNYVKEYKDLNKYLIRIANYTEKLKNHSQIGAIEWWICDGELYSTDISLDKNAVSIIDKDIKYLSEGYIEGFALFLDDLQLEMLDSVAYGQGISVDYTDEAIENFEFYNNIRKKILDYKKIGKVILCSRRPIIGIAPFVNMLDGLIFEEASVLCHLAVVLREKNIPAVAIGEKYKNIIEGQNIIIS